MNIAEPKLGKWIPVDADALIRESRSVEAPAPAFGDRGSFTVSLSPYDVPEAMRVGTDENGRCVVIEFKYLTPSEPVAETGTKFIKIYLGKNSGRIYSIRACAQEGERDVFSVQLESDVQKELKKLEQKATFDFGPRQRVKVIEGLTRNIYAHGIVTFTGTVTPRYVEAPPEDQSKPE